MQILIQGRPGHPSTRPTERPPGDNRPEPAHRYTEPVLYHAEQLHCYTLSVRWNTSWTGLVLLDFKRLELSPGLQEGVHWIRIRCSRATDPGLSEIPDPRK